MRSVLINYWRMDTRANTPEELSLMPPIGPLSGVRVWPSGQSHGGRAWPPDLRFRACKMTVEDIGPLRRDTAAVDIGPSWTPCRGQWAIRAR